MSKILRTLAVVAAALALPALAGPSWPPAPPRAKVPNPTSKGGFEYVGGDAGCQVSQHKYEFAKGRGFVMSDECDHVKRTVKAATPAEIEATQRLSPGA